MAFKSGNLTFVKPLYGAFTLVRNFVCGFPENNDPVFTPNAPRTLGSMLFYFGEKPNHGEAYANGTWTITCTNADTPGSAVFSVAHSSYVTVFPDATENVLYDEAAVTFKISSEDSGSYVVGDVYTVETTGLSANDTPWILHKMVDATTNSTFCQMEGPGLTDDKHINVIMRPYSEFNTNGQFYGLGFRFAQGYTETDPYDQSNQPGVDNNDSWMALESQSGYTNSFELPYHIICNKQRFIFLLTANTTHRGVYCGYFYPYGSPGQYNFPMFIGAEQNGNNSDNRFPYSSTSGEVRSFVDPGYAACRIALPGNSRNYVYHYNDSSNVSYTSASSQIWPYGDPYGRWFYQNLIEQENGNYSMFPCVIRDNASSPDQILGELDGVCAVPGNNLTPGDIIQNSALEDFVVWRDTFRSETYSYYAVRLL